mmetsp:Transcript_60493/g.124511  ORF Transcript_60493/g.124511 Transcript_60493/m.124511 type:complete len:85 (-) Transcript_60493:744-998(-)
MTLERASSRPTPAPASTGRDKFIRGARSRSIWIAFASPESPDVLLRWSWRTSAEKLANSSAARGAGKNLKEDVALEDSDEVSDL